MSEIIEGDVVDVLSRFSTERRLFDLIIADPPYNIDKDFGGLYGVMEWDDYVRWMREWIDVAFSVLDAEGLMYVYGLPEVIGRVAVHYPIEAQRWLVWHYTNKAVPSSTFWQRSYETILCLWHSEGFRPALNVDEIREPYTDSHLKSVGKERKDVPSRFRGGGRQTFYTAHQNGALPRDVIQVPALAGGAGHSERWFLCRSCNNTLYAPNQIEYHRECDVLKHPTQKPMKLSQRLIASSGKGADCRLLIPFAGSGSECVVAQGMGVDCTGIEINSEFVSFGRQWLNQPLQEKSSQLLLWN